MPRGLNRQGDFRNGSPVTTPIDFGTDITLPHTFGNDVNWQPDPAHFGNPVTWTPNPAHFGNIITPPFPAPTFTSVTPNNGATTGGTSVAIVGSGFSVPGLEVLIGGNPCTSVVASDDTHLTCNSPAGTVGSTDIEIITEGGSVDVPNAWTYTAPAIALVDHVISSGTSFAGGGITTGAINSTGASMLVLAINGFSATSNQSSNAITITDSKGNTYVPVPYGRGNSPGVALFYCPTPIVGSGHTVNVTMSDSGSGGYISLTAWSGTLGLAPIGQITNSSVVSNANIVPPFQAGAVGAGQAGDLFLSFLAGYNGFSSTSGLPASVDSGLTIVDQLFNATVGAGGACGGLAVGYILPSNTTPINPTWTAQAAMTQAQIVNVIFGQATSGIQLIAAVKGTSASTLTTSAIDTTGANFLIASFAQYNNAGQGALNFTDSKGNTWHKITWNNGGDFGKPTFYYAFNAIVGSGHTFSTTNSDVQMTVFAFSGVKSSSDPLESANDSSTIEGVSTYQAASAITPASAGDLVITAIGNIFATNPYAVFLSVDQDNHTLGWTPINGNDPAGAMAWSLAPDSTTALQPTWIGTVSGSNFNRGYNNFAVFAKA